MSQVALHSYLELVNICDNFHIRNTSTNKTSDAGPFDDEKLVPFTLDSSPQSPAIGLIRPAMMDQIKHEIALSEQQRIIPMWEITESPQNRVSFSPNLSNPDLRTAAMKELCERWRDAGIFEEQIGPKKWRQELYPVYRNPFGVQDKAALGDDPTEDSGNFAFEMERSACALFGVVTYGVHMTIYAEEEGGMKIWVPTRAKTKQTWGGYLDNSVAGGIPSGMPKFESIVKESMEEASIAEEIVRKYARSVGSVSYYNRTSKGWLQPEIQYVYDLRIPPGANPESFTPKPLDGEVESFELLPVAQVIQKMREGKFKSNCALVNIEFFIRHGYITPDEEPDFQDIVTRLHGRFDYDKWLLVDSDTFRT